MKNESENKNLFTITNDKGEKVECEVILTIDSEEFGHSYIVYTDHTMDDSGNIKFDGRQSFIDELDGNIHMF